MFIMAFVGVVRGLWGSILGKSSDDSFRELPDVGLAPSALSMPSLKPHPFPSLPTLPIALPTAPLALICDAPGEGAGGGGGWRGKPLQAAFGPRPTSGGTLSLLGKTSSSTNPKENDSGGAPSPYILNQDISKWHFSARGAI